VTDQPSFGDRRINRRIKPDRRHYPSRGRIARVGPCHECGEETEHVAVWNGEPVRLCPKCATRIRGGEV
jgi:formylmethanofuran dehydrogenase subunit E